MNRIGERGKPYANPPLTSRATSVQKSSDPILAKRSLIKLAIRSSDG
jgi:hypothetical protein